ncbi:YiiD C-terminal domain-containing protein [Kistimonas asteriae]|uniref:YiiD C-terminal domain-containing protein n=1 Tax=Kistimonas asteriae TaxID=517724 RepID=UPI001BA964C2|nr:YiiD C-terminal domain-containing protein [Kistimonas asteriae]
MTLPLPLTLQKKLSKIPMLRAMEIDYRLYDGKQLQLACPLPPNINDKGTFFGGSISALATICGWTMTSLKALEVGTNCDVVIAEQNLQFLTPACSELTATCECTVPETFNGRLQAGRRARLDLTVSLHSDGERVANFNGRYVAVPT